MVVGGFVVGASAMAAVIGLHNVFGNDESAFLRGSNQSHDSSDTLLQGDQSVVSQSANTVSNQSKQVISNQMDSTAAPTAAPSGADSSPVPTYSPSQQPDTLFPTNLPTYDGEFPTEVPTKQDELNASYVSPNHSILRAKEVGVRLKLYWEEGYFWQERYEEKWWCMACPDGKCEKNDKMELNNCKKKNDRDATFVVTSPSNAGHQFRVTNTDLCLQKMGDRRAIKLKPCKTNTPLQLFIDYKPDEKFDLRPVEYTGRCLSNHHHPKAGETIYAETCKKAHRTDTGYWVAY